MDGRTAVASASERCRIPLQRPPSTAVVTLIYQRAPPSRSPVQRLCRAQFAYTRLSAHGSCPAFASWHKHVVASWPPRRHLAWFNRVADFLTVAICQSRAHWVNCQMDAAGFAAPTQ